MRISSGGKPALSATTARPALPISARRSAIPVVSVCAFAMFLNNGFMLVGWSVFDPLMLARLAVSVGALKVGDSITLGTVALAAPLAGYLIDRFGPRGPFLAGTVIMAIAFVAYGRASSLRVVYLVHLLSGISLLLSGGFVCVIVVSMTTRGRRGLGLGVLFATASLGSAVAPAILTDLLHNFGLSGALDLMGAVSALTLPLIALSCPSSRALGVVILSPL